MAEFDMPNNSHAFKNGQVKEKPKTQKVIEGTAKTKKKTGARKLADIFLPEDVTSVKEYIFWERIVPAIKDIIHDTVDTFLYGESRRPNYSSYSSGSRISYSGYSSSNTRSDPRKDVNRPRNAFDYDDIIFDSRIQGEQVLDNLIDILDQYNIVTVSDLYDSAGITTTNYMVNRYGWDNLADSSVVRVREGYTLKLPKAKPI